jgi:excisionase family DNA binding protein
MGTREIFSTHTAAKICRVTPMTVIRWIDEGRIQAFRTAGGHRRIARSSLEAFCRDAGIPFDEGSLQSTLHAVVVTADDALAVAIRDVLAGEAAPWEVHRASTGFEVGQLMASQHPRLVVVDHDTPGLDALGVLAQIASHEPGQTPVLGLVTPDTVKLSPAAARAAGSPAHLTLPITADQIEPLARAAERERRRRRRDATTTPPARQPRILLVDGEARDLDDLSHAMTRTNRASVTYVTSLAEALLHAGRSAPEAMVLSGGRSDAELLDVCRRVKSYGPTRNVRLLVVLEEERPRSDLMSRLDADDLAACLVGPVNAEQLVEALAGSA